MLKKNECWAYADKLCLGVVTPFSPKLTIIGQKNGKKHFWGLFLVKKYHLTSCAKKIECWAYADKLFWGVVTPFSPKLTIISQKIGKNTFGGYLLVKNYHLTSCTKKNWDTTPTALILKLKISFNVPALSQMSKTSYFFIEYIVRRPSRTLTHTHSQWCAHTQNFDTSSEDPILELRTSFDVLATSGMPKLINLLI